MIAIIPARGGSKGLPRKNIMALNGKPLISYSISAALESQSITDVIVTTDDLDIANVAVEYGAKVPFIREAHLATDNAKAIDVYLDALERLEKNSLYCDKLESFVVLLPTCPLRNAEDIDHAVKLFRNKQADSVISYTLESHPLQWHKYINNDNSFMNIFPETIDNRQSQRPTYYPNGAIYVFKRSLIENNSYYSKRSYCYIMPRDRSVDIDTQYDFDFAAFLLQHQGL